MISCTLMHPSFCKLQQDYSQQIPKFPAVSNQTQLNRNHGQLQGVASQNSSNRTYRWNEQQNTRYIQFLFTYLGLFDLSLQKRRKIKIQVMMSNFIGTRSPNQCRSHHQKMLNKYQNVPNIVNKYTHLLSDDVNYHKKQLIKKEEGGLKFQWEQQEKIKDGWACSKSEEILRSQQENNRVIKEEEIINQESYVFYKTFY